MAVQAESQGQVQEFVQILAKRRWQVILPALFLTALGSAIAVILPRQWKTQSRIEVQGVGQESQLQNAQHYIRHFARVKEIVERLKWSDYLQLGDVERTEYIRSMLDNISVGTILPDPKQNKDGAASAFVDIEYVGSDPSRAQFFLNKLVEAWQRDVIERELSTVQNDRDRYQNERQEARRKTDELSSQITDKLAQVGLDWGIFLKNKTTTVEDPIYARIASNEARLDEIKTELSTLREEKAALEEQHADMPAKIVLEEVEQAEDLSASITALENKIDGLKKIQEAFLPAHPRYHQVQEQIEDAEKELKELEDEATQAQVTQSYVDNPERKDVERRIADAEVKIRELDGEARDRRSRLELDNTEYRNRLNVIREVADLREDLDRWYLIRDEAESRYVSASNQVAKLTDPNSNPFSVVEEAMAPKSPEPPSPIVVVVFAAVAGLAIGLGSALMGEFSRNCYRSVNDVTRVLALPVLGVVNTIVTGHEIRRARLRRLTVGLSSLVLIGGLAWFTWAWKARQDLLPTEVVQYIDDLRVKLR